MLLSRSPRTRAVLISAIITAAVACGALGVAPRSAGATLAYSVHPFELQVVQLVNGERALRGVGPLTPEARLWQSAESHNQWMASVGYLSHTGSGGSTLATRAVAAGYTSWTALGEVLGVGYATAQDVVNGWKGSPSHWTILMNPVYRDIGAAYLMDAGGTPWWTADLGNNQGPGQPIVVGSAAATTVPTIAPTATRTPTRIPPTLPSPTRTTIPTNVPSSTRPPSTATAVPVATATSRPTLAPVSMLAGRATLQGRADSTTIALYVDGVKRSSAGPDGTFMVLGVSAGSHVIEARAPGWLPSRKTVLVPASQFVIIGDTKLLAGDIYADLRITQFDVELIRAGIGRCLGTTSYQRHLDLNLSGCIDIADVQLSAGNLGRAGPTNWSLTP